MRELSSWKIIIIGFILVVLGFVFPLLMTLQIVASSFALNFFSFGASVLGLFLGLVGAAWYVREHKLKK